jgi:hypothetical protein
VGDQTGEQFRGSLALGASLVQAGAIVANAGHAHVTGSWRRGRALRRELRRCVVDMLRFELEC